MNKIRQKPNLVSLPQSIARCNAVSVLMILIFAIGGCSKTKDQNESTEKPPKPVTVMTLSQTRQLQKQLITGSIAPWKTEQIGFEGAGRVNFVIEVNEEVQPRLPSDSAPPPTPLATIDRERFEIAVETAKADVQVAQRKFEANQVAIDQRIPATIESAKSEMGLAGIEFERSLRLIRQKAIARSEHDSSKNRLRVAESELTTAKAQLMQAKAEQAALQAQVIRASHALEEARRSLRNTSLFSSFRGIVADVHTVPGSFVDPGQPVVTVQMMDPMLVQFEVSPNDSRKYAKGDILDVFVSDKTGNRRRANGMVYTVDAVADPNSRTYTVTLHMRNRKESITSGDSNEHGMAQVRRIFSLNVGPVITGNNQQLVEQSCLHKIGDETVVWRIANRKANQASNAADRVLIVEPIKVTHRNEVIPLLGQWKFVSVQFNDPTRVDIENDLITDQLIFADKPPNSNQNEATDLDPWAPRKVLLQQQEWLLRSGDVVQVVMSGSNVDRGYFVPIKAVLNDNGRTYLHLAVNSSEGVPVAKRVEVSVQKKNSLSGDSISVQVLPVEADALQDGMQVVIAGSHYLTDGARINVVENGSSN